MLAAPTQQPQSDVLNVFLKDEQLCGKEYATALVGILDFKGKFDLCLDRSNWKFGKTHINYLVLSWRISKDLSLPLFFVDLDKAGNSSTQERLDLLELFTKVFGTERINSLMADREFVGNQWFETLNQKDISFFIRVKNNTMTLYGKNGLEISEYFEHLQPSQTRLIEKDMFGQTVYFAGTRSNAGDLVIVMTNQELTARDILNTYKKRWSIE